MSQLEFYKSYQFVLELLVAEFIFCRKLEKKNLFSLTLPISIVLIFVLARFFPIPESLNNNAFYLSFCFFSIFFYTIICGRFIFKEDLVKIIFCLFAGYTVQHTSYEIYNFVLALMGLNTNSLGFYSSGEISFFKNPLAVVIYIGVYTLTYFIAIIFFSKKIERKDKLKVTNSYILIFSIILFVVDIMINSIVVCYIAPDSNKLYLSVTSIYNIICCIIVLFLMFEVATKEKLQDLLNMVNILRQREKEQYKTTKENIDLINMKCHDLKHFIRNKNFESVEEIEKMIQIYDSNLHTGNDAIDVVLMEKLLKCNNNGIKLSCIIDGKSLLFMSENDIYSLFGNLIDNAIEAVEKLEKNKRVISLKVRSVRNFVSINIHNYYSHNIVYENGLPVTTKNEKNYHGFGMKSIEYICYKYNGSLSINSDKNVFNVNIIFSTKK